MAVLHIFGNFLTIFFFKNAQEYGFYLYVP